MKRATVLSLICLSVIILSGCSNVTGNIETSNINEETKQESDNKESSDKAEVERNTELKIDKQAIISNYESSKQDFGDYYYIWDSPKFDIPLLLITDNCVDEDEEFFKPGTAFSCMVYCADPENINNIEHIGEIEAPSTAYPLTEDEDGLYVAFHHYVYQYIPDYSAKELIVWNGFEDDVVSNLKEHSGFLEIKEGIVKEVESVDMDIAYDLYNSANVIIFAKTADESVEIDFKRDDRSEMKSKDGKVSEMIQLYYDEALLPDTVKNHKKINADIESKKEAFFKENEDWGGFNLDELVQKYSLDDIFCYAILNSVYLDDNYYSVNIEKHACYGGGDISKFIGYTYDLETGEEVDITDVLNINKEELSSMMHDRLALYDINPSMDGYPNAPDFLVDETWGRFNFCIAQEGRIYALYDRNTIAAGYQGSGAYYITDLNSQSNNIQYSRMYEIEGGQWHNFTADIKAELVDEMNIRMNEEVDFKEKEPVEEGDKWYVPIEFYEFNRELSNLERIAAAKVDIDNPSNIHIIQAAYDNIIDFDSCISKEDHDKLADIVAEYCSAKAAGNMELIKLITHDTQQMEEYYTIEENSKYLDSISNPKLYVLKGYRSGSYCVLVTYYENYSGLDKGIPGIDYLYICKNNEDEFYINFAELDEVEQKYVDAMAGEDVSEFEPRYEIGEVWDDIGIGEFNRLLFVSNPELGDAFFEIDNTVRNRVEERMKDDEVRQLKVKSVEATSTLKTASKDKSDYKAENLIDGKISTAWIEGVDGTGEGEEITLHLDDEYEITKLVIYNGFLKTKRRYTINGKVDEIMLSSNRSSTTYRVNIMHPGDNEEEFELNELGETVIETSGRVTDTIRIRIEKAEKGSIYEDTAISEIEIYGKPAK